MTNHDDFLEPERAGHDPIAALAREQRLRDLASVIPAGEWRWEVSLRDGQIVIWAGAEPIATATSVDIAKYLCALAPEAIFGA